MFFTVLIGAIVVFSSIWLAAIICKPWDKYELWVIAQLQKKANKEHRELYSRRIGWHLSRVNDETENGMYL